MLETVGRATAIEFARVGSNVALCHRAPNRAPGSKVVGGSRRPELFSGRPRIEPRPDPKLGVVWIHPRPDRVHDAI
jgi:hypothetical protein